ncbi:glycosyltransferase family A protein, partial [Bombilactobacillus bombi]|uniref:glycosyltransferase family A protein n=1 Tax=Bombilactobacillus bombi TaxID=1303590 RepID=UPI0015E6044B
MITIILPVYNVYPYLNQCLESIFAQTYKNIQLIIVNDGSTDKSSTIINKYIQFQKNNKILNDVIYIKQKNSGLSAARNAAIPYIKGKLTWFIDSDDLLSNKQSIEKVMCVFSKYPQMSILFFNVDNLFETSKDIWNKKIRRENKYYNQFQIKNINEFLKEVLPTAPVWAYVVKT